MALLDLGDSGGESAAADLNNEFGKDRAIFVICDVSKNEQLKGNSNFHRYLEVETSKGIKTVKM